MVYSIQVAEKDGAIASTLISNQLMAGGGVALIDITLVPLLPGHFG